MSKMRFGKRAVEENTPGQRQCTAPQALWEENQGTVCKKKILKRTLKQKKDWTAREYREKRGKGSAHRRNRRKKSKVSERSGTTAGAGLKFLTEIAERGFRTLVRGPRQGKQEAVIGRLGEKGSGTAKNKAGGEKVEEETG